MVKRVSELFNRTDIRFPYI